MGLEFTGPMITEIVGYISAIFSDMSGLLLLIVGVGLGLFVIGTIIRIIRG